MNKYDRLTSLDASFLHMERLEYPMHVGAMSLIEGAPFFDDSGHFRIKEVRDLVQSRSRTAMSRSCRRPTTR
jgi:diacylglycerol O-acyltransferase